MEMDYYYVITLAGDVYIEYANESTNYEPKAVRINKNQSEYILNLEYAQRVEMSNLLRDTVMANE